MLRIGPGTSEGLASVPQAFNSFSRDSRLFPLGALQDPTYYFHSSTANIICSIVFGKRFAYRDPEFLQLLDLLFQTFLLISSFPSQVGDMQREGRGWGGHLGGGQG